jgi:hypothetical protein
VSSVILASVILSLLKDVEGWQLVFFVREGVVYVSFLLEGFHQVGHGLGLLRLPVEETVEELQEDPLCPFVVPGFTGTHFAVPVEAEANVVELAAEVVDVLRRAHRRVNAMLQGVLFGGQAKGVVSHGVQHVESLQPFKPAVNVAGDVAKGMPHMEPGPAGVGKHIEHIILGLGALIAHPVGPGGDPLRLPFFLYRTEVVFHFLAC